ncbi:amylo-alpha-1,6-glucosidase [Pseudoduganella sp. GCM10020061]|uniref:amylo-alpha-1,6-glucosidase n=1 Tax=Pseudoduganella sp. GCM10020061 TaxID=3317345 RepID=UPI003639FB22
MKKLVLAVGAALTIMQAQAAQKPGPDAFFNEMAIAVAPGEERHYVVGDNVDGYFDAVTQSYDKGQGYVTRAGTWLKNYVTYVGDHANDRTRSREEVLPYGHRITYPDGAVEEMAVLSGSRAIAMRITAPREASLALQPTLTGEAEKLARVDRNSADGKLVTVALPGGYMALASREPFVMEEALLLRPKAKTTSFTVIAAFGETAAQAQRQAVALAAVDAIGAERAKLHRELTKSYIETSDRQYNKALNWAKASARMFVVEEFGKGIWAGLPWFRDNWGRDTFIALPGTLLVSGQFNDAKAVLANFPRYQNLDRADKNFGRVPNRVSATEAIIYNTVDGTPWMLREAIEYIRYTGDKAFAAQMYKTALPYFEGVAKNFIDKQGLMTHDDADTWMDARIANKEPWSARGSRAVDIQALWYEALNAGAYLATQAGDEARAREWSAMAGKVKRSFLELFWDGKTMADRIRPDGSRDTKLRPNQLMLVSIPSDDFVPLDVQAAVTRNAASGLLYEYGIASLGQEETYFHPRHENPDFHHKDASYHNGTIWGWNAGFTVTALNKFGYQDHAWKLTSNLGKQILETGTLGTMSELVDALPPLKPSGTFAQSWSVAEFARNAYQDYVGFRPDLLANTLRFEPALPAAWKSVYAVLPFGADERVEAQFADGQWTLTLAGATPRKVEFSFFRSDKSRMRVAFELKPGVPARLALNDAGATLDGKAIGATEIQPSFAKAIGELKFVTPKRYQPEDFPMLKSKDVLKGIIERGEYR